MKIEITKLKTVPKQLSTDFELCVFGEPSEEIKSWIEFHNFKTHHSGPFTNIKITKPVEDIFVSSDPFEYMDGFSPNLKNLHVGHFSNLVLAKAFTALGIAKQNVSLLGDTLKTESKDESLILLNKYCDDWKYNSKQYFASQVLYNGDILKYGSGEYEGTKIFEIGDDKIVGIKSSGHTSYFYQDVAFAEILNASTIYLTGKEQTNHFSILKKLYPYIHHIGLGLVKVHGQKMSTSMGNVFLIQDFIDLAKSMFGDDMKLIYNVFAGYILKAQPESDKNINMDMINNPKNSGGLYISYTMAKMHSAGMDFISGSPSNEMAFAYTKAKETYSPNFLFDYIIDICKKINVLYTTHAIKGNTENQKLYQPLLTDILWATEKLGMFWIEKV